MKLSQSLGIFDKVIRGRAPAQLVIQMTDACNATCPQCGMRANNIFKRSGIEPSRIRRALDRFSDIGGAAVSFTGGEPFLFFEDLVDLIEYAEKKGIRYIRTGTNGFFMKNPDEPGFKDKISGIAERLSGTGIRNLWISLDSSDAVTHEKMRGLKDVVRGIEKALPVFHSFGIYPSVNLGINRNMAGFDQRLDYSDRDEFYEKTVDAFRKFYSFSVDLGFTIANCCYPMSVGKGHEKLNAVYAATSDDVTSFDVWEKILIYKALFKVIPEFRDKIRIFSPRSSLFALICQHEGDPGKSYPCLGGIDYFFMSAADGLAYPCGYRGNECLGEFSDIDMKRLGAEPHCRECDWECFRDPSELFSPLLMLKKEPLALFRRIALKDEYLRIWKEDILYYRKCGFFNGRKPFLNGSA